MTFREYLDQYTCSGIVNGVKKLLIERKISKPYHDTVNSLLLRAHGTQDAAKVVSSHMIKNYRYLVIYELLRLDLKKKALVTDSRNINLQPTDLVNRFSRLDLRMESFPDVETMRSVVSIMVCLTILQCATLHKDVEIDNLMKKPFRVWKENLLKTFAEAQELFNDNIHYCKLHNQSADILGWMIPEVPAAPSSKAF